MTFILYTLALVGILTLVNFFSDDSDSTTKPLTNKRRAEIELEMKLEKDPEYLTKQEAQVQELEDKVDMITAKLDKAKLEYDEKLVMNTVSYKLGRWLGR